MGFCVVCCQRAVTELCVCVCARSGMGSMQCVPQVREFTHRYDVPSERTVTAASVKTRKSA